MSTLTEAQNDLSGAHDYCSWIIVNDNNNSLNWRKNFIKVAVHIWQSVNQVEKKRRKFLKAWRSEGILSYNWTSVTNQRGQRSSTYEVTFGTKTTTDLHLKADTKSRTH